MGKIETDVVTSSRARSRSNIRDKLFDLELKALLKNAYVNCLLANNPKGEHNLNPTEDQELIQCPSFGLSNYTKTFCVSKSWWGIRPKDSNWASNLVSVHWSS